MGGLNRCLHLYFQRRVGWRGAGIPLGLLLFGGSWFRSLMGPILQPLLLLSQLLLLFCRSVLFRGPPRRSLLCWQPAYCHQPHGQDWRLERSHQTLAGNEAARGRRIPRSIGGWLVTRSCIIAADLGLIQLGGGGAAVEIFESDLWQLN